MRSERKKQIMTLSILVVAILVISVGFAAFSTTLRIDSSASVNPNASDFSVKFSTEQNTLTVADVVPSNKTEGITATNGEINNSSSPIMSNLSAEFTTPGDYVEYKFYARNEGQYQAYLNNINYVGEKSCTPGEGATASLVNTACEGIKMTVSVAGTTYEGTTPITGHSLAKNTGEEIIVRIEYLSTGALSDGAFTVTLPQITMVYSTVDDSTYTPIVYTGPIYRISDEKIYLGDVIDAENYETTLENISQNIYLKHDIVDNVVTASYTCMVYTENEEIKEACLRGGDKSYYASSQETIIGLDSYFKTLSKGSGTGSCSSNALFAYCRSDSINLDAANNGSVISNNDSIKCTVDANDGSSDCEPK